MTKDQIDHIDRINTWRIQADAVLGLMRYSGPDTPDDFYSNAAWLVQDLIRLMETEADAAVRIGSDQ